MKALSACLLALLLCCAASAQPLNTSQQKRADRLDNQLRCLVCQNESLAESSAPLALQLRGLIRQQIAHGASDQQILHFMVQRYGIFVLLKPPLSPLTGLLYASPILALLLGIGGFWFSRRQPKKNPAPLTTDEQTRLDELLK